MKKKVMQYFTLIAGFVALLAVLHFWHFGGLTAFVIFGDSYSVDFVSPTPSSTTPNDYIYANVSSSGGEHYSFVDFEDDLVSWIRFDDANEDQIFDISTHGGDGMMLGDGYITSNGKYGSAGVFDGNGDYVTFSDSAALNSISSNGEMTFCLWMNPKTTNTPYSEFVGALGQWRTWNGASAVNERGWGLLEGLSPCSPGEYGLFISATGNSPYGTACTNSAVPLNQWTHVCGTYDNPTITLYVNGVAQSETGTIGGIYNSPANFTIGTYLFSASGAGGLSDIYFNGSLDDVLLFNRALTLQEIRSIYNATQYQYVHNFSNLADDTYNFTAHSVNTDGDRGSVTRMVTTGTEIPLDEPPTVTLNSPTAGQVLTTDIITFNITVSDDIDLENVSLWGNWTGAWSVNETNSSGLNGVYLFTKNLSSFGEGTYFWGVSALDNASQQTVSANRSFTIDYPGAIPLNVSFVSPTPSGTVNGNSIFVNVSSTSSSTAYTLVDFNRDLLLWVRMDDLNASGGLVDRSRYGNNGSKAGGVVVNSTGGKFGNGSVLDGSTGRIIMPDNSVLDSPGVVDRITLCAWFKVDTHQTGYRGVAGKWNSVGDQRQYLLTKNSADNKYGFLLSSNGSSHVTNGVEVFTSSALSTDTWYHMCGVFNGTTRLYLNGALNAQNLSSIGGINANSAANFEIGTFNQVTTYAFDGSIDEVMLWNRSLSANEILSLYNSTAAQYYNNFSNLSDGNYTFSAYVVDSSGNLSSVSRTVETTSVEIDDAPSVTLNSPTAGQGFTSDIIVFNITVSDDIDLKNVSLWGNWSGWALTDTNTSGSDGVHIFTRDLSAYGEGTYLWGVSAWDNASQQTVSENRTFVINYPAALPEITYGASLKQEKGPGLDYIVNLTTSHPATDCWFSYDHGITNTSMYNLGSQYFYFEDLPAGQYDMDFYCENEHGFSTINRDLEFRRVYFANNQHYTNTQGLDIYFDFGYNDTAESSHLIVIPDSWTSTKDDTWVTQTELLYVGEGYVAVPINTRGKGSSEGSRDAFGWECLDIYEMIGHLENTEPYSQLIDADVHYISGASGAGGKAGVCASKYPDLFSASFASVGVLNLTEWWYWPSIPQVYFDSIDDRVGCTPPNCPEAYLARDASYLVSNTFSPLMAVANADDASVTVECSRDYNRSAVLHDKIMHYKEFASGGHSTYRFSESLPFFANYTSPIFMPSSGDLIVGGYVQTKNFSVFLLEENVSHIAFLEYDLSGLEKTFNLSTWSFEGDFNLSLFGMAPGEDYLFDVNGIDSTHTANGDGVLTATIFSESYSSSYIVVSPAGAYCGDSSCNNGETCSDCSADCGVCSGGDDGSGGGGSSGGGVFAPNKAKLQFSDMGEIIIRRGTSDNTVLEVSNNGRGFANSCRVSFEGLGSEWLSSSETKGLSPGEKISYSVSSNIPEDAEPGNYALTAKIACEETETTTSLSLYVYYDDFEVEILDHVVEGNQLLVRYSLREFAGVDRSLTLHYVMSKLDGQTHYEGLEEFDVLASQEGIEEIRFELPKDSFGEFTFAVYLSDGKTQVSDTDEIFLPSRTGLTGLAISDDNKRTLSYVGIIVLLGIIAFSVAWIITKLAKKKKRENLKGDKRFSGKRDLMEIEL